MKSIDLCSFFNKVNYNWKKDEKKIKNICYFTKTRPDATRDASSFELTYGMEQVFLLKSIVEHFNVENMFEIGTGRGTGCYAAALSPNVENIITVDILPFEYKRPTAIGFRPVVVSNFDIFCMIPFLQKRKIKFKHISNTKDIVDTHRKTIDFCFIDGDHENEDIIKKDYENCKALIKDKGLILFDDYHPDKFNVKKVVDQILKEDSNLDSLLINMHGHLFDKSNKTTDNGVVLIKEGSIF
jgi:predicted O-methyltransferase YrrM